MADEWSDVKFNFNDLMLTYSTTKSLYGYEEEEYKGQIASGRDCFKNSVQIFRRQTVSRIAHGWINYGKRSASNYSYDRPVIGLNGKIFRKLAGTIKVGYNFNKRKNLKDLNGTLFYSMLTYKATPRLHYNLSAIKGLGSINLINEGVTKYHEGLL